MGEDIFLGRTIDLILGIVLVGIILLGVMQEKRIENLENKIKRLEGK